MSAKLDITKLAMSWTKYSVVQLIDVISSEEEIKKFKNKEKGIDESCLKKFLGIQNLSDKIPNIWIEIQKHPKQKRLFALLGIIFTHHESINKFATLYSNEKMGGIFVMDKGKQYTNLRSALVVSGASLNSFRRKEEVPYSFKPLYENGEVGKLFKELIIQKLNYLGWNGENFYDVCYELDFHRAISLTQEQFKDWTEGNTLVKSKLSDNLESLKKHKEITTYKVDQWLKEWDDINFAADEMRKKPNPFFIMFKMDARLLKRLSDVHRRKSEDSAIKDLSVQRPHNESRSQEIHNYIHGGFPWSTISETQRQSEEYKDLKMPGILPTAIIANILAPDSERGKYSLQTEDSIQIKNINSDFPTLIIPDSVFSEDWDPNLKPFEIIDGQHRLWAFDEEEDLNGNYELPVIAYYDLDRAWQAYLFYTINIKPVKINTSLGYDLYPLLRTQNWLEPLNDGLTFYRENRAQELVEALWIYKESPWRNRIKMLGEGEGNISQASFINTLTSSFLKKPTNKGIGGLFSNLITQGGKNKVLNWNRTQQAGFLILFWDLILESLNIYLEEEEEEEDGIDILSEEPSWAKSIREYEKQEDRIEGMHPAFTSKNSFLSRDQGVRGISMFLNDFFYFLASDDSIWNLNELAWDDDLDEKTILADSIDKAIQDFKEHNIYGVLKSLSREILKMDWRTGSSDFTDNPEQKFKQMSYKGSSGYTMIWKELVVIISTSKDLTIQKYTNQISEFIK